MTALVWGMDRQKGIGWNVRCAAGAFFGRLFWSFSIKKKTNSWDQNFSVKSRSVCLVVCLSSGLSVVRSVCRPVSLSVVVNVIRRSCRPHPSSSVVRSVGRSAAARTDIRRLERFPNHLKTPHTPAPAVVRRQVLGPVCWVRACGSLLLGCWRVFAAMGVPLLFYNEDDGGGASEETGSQPSSILPGWF